ncbi:MAG: GldG family protein, partial [bacterium]
VVFGIFQRKLFKIFFEKKAVKATSNLGITIIAVIGIIIVCNLLSSKYHKRLDLTLLKLFSLSPQTEKILENLKKEVVITCFFQKGDARKTVVENILKEYKNKNSKIKINFVDPDIEIQKAVSYKIREYGTLVFECGTRRKDINVWGEQEITSTIFKIMKEEEKNYKIYFLTGHGEYDYDTDDMMIGASNIKEPLKKEGYELEKLNLLENKEQGQEIPKDCNILVVFGPKKDLAKEEKEIIKKYVENKGKLFLLLDPKPSPGLTDLAKNWGVEIKDDMVIDKSLNFQQNPLIPTINTYGFHQITKEFREKKIMSMYPLSRSIDFDYNSQKGFTFFKLLETTRNSWGEVNIDFTKTPVQDERDIFGPLIIGVALEKNFKEEDKNETSRIVIIGDADFASNRCIGIWCNLDVFMNSINWLSEEEALISIRAKDLTIKKVEFSNRQQKNIFYSCVIILPFLIILGGTIVWWRRR